MGQPLVLNNIPKAPVMGTGDGHIVSVAVKISLPKGKEFPQALINGLIKGTITVDAEAIASAKYKIKKEESMAMSIDSSFFAFHKRIKEP